MLKVSVEGNRVRIGERFSMSFQRTLRIPDDGKTYPLPPGLGLFPIHAVSDYLGRIPDSWQATNSFFIPMYQREALWLGFDGATWKPNAVKIGVGKVNVISGQAWDETLQSDPQNYIICPDQPWLDGINTGEGLIRQFVAMPLGLGYTVEAQVRGVEEFGGIQILVYEPKPGRFPDQPPPERNIGLGMRFSPMSAKQGMGLGAGGKMRQKIYPDPYGMDTWDLENYGCVFVYIINSERYQELTDIEPPPTPINAQTYTEYELPWFEIYDEHKGDIAASERLAKVKTIREQEAERGIADQEDDVSVDVTESDIKKLHSPGSS